ncbi:MAG: alanine dehydrogenase [Anaerolineales bacterium]
MNIGIPKERRPFEYRVGLSPAGVEMLVQRGHTVFIEHEAGIGAGFSDQEYERSGAHLVYSPHEVFGRADLLLKVTRPMQDEIQWLNQGAALMGLLHLASTRQDRIDSLLANKITAIAYEQIRLADGTMPVLRALSQIGGLMTAQIAARLLQNNWGGKGILLGGVAGVPPAEIVIIGGGTSGTCAAMAFLGMGAHVTVLDKSMDALQRIHERFPQVVTMMSTRRNIDRACAFADVVVGAVLVPGERSPIVVPRDTLKSMKQRALMIDLSIDQGGSFETSRPTTHDHPTYIEEGIMHYCVPNVPGVVARTATHAFVNSAMPYIIEVADLGASAAIEANPALAIAVNTHAGEMRNLQRWVAQEEE